MVSPDDRWFTNESAFVWTIIISILLCCCGTCGIWWLQRWNKKYQERRDKQTSEAIKKATLESRLEQPAG